MAPMLALAWMALAGCTGDSGDETTDVSTEADTDTDADADADADTDSDSDSDADTDPVVCAGTEILDGDGLPSGFEECVDGSVNRIASTACDPLAGLEPPCKDPGQPLLANGCLFDFTCGPNGHCVSGFGTAHTGYQFCNCVSTCATDADCGPGSVCMCGGTGLPGSSAHSQCVPASCETGADCGSGECGLEFTRFGQGCPTELALSCRAGHPDDACRADADCPAPWQEYCGPLVDGGPWECVDYSGIACAM